MTRYHDARRVFDTLSQSFVEVRLIAVQMLKFRSMRVDAEKQTGAVWAVKDDPRRTRLGTFLRKTSLDELPQRINVLFGDMSSRPAPGAAGVHQEVSATIPSYGARHAVKTGITGPSVQSEGGAASVTLICRPGSR